MASELSKYGFPEGVTTVNVEEWKDIIRVSLKELIEQYAMYDEKDKLSEFDPKKIVKPLLAVGPPGVGKSQAVYEVAYEINVPEEVNITDEEKIKEIQELHNLVRGYGEQINVIDLRLSQLDPTDIKGLPRFTDGSVEWVLPEFLPRDVPGEKFGILFLDEINLAPPAVQAACYQLILDRKVGESYELPKGWLIVAAMNPPEMAHIAYPLPPPLVNRFTILYVEPDPQIWIRWAVISGIDPDIVAYISRNPNALFEFDPSGEPYPTPRTWEYVDLYVKRADEYTEDELEALVCGSIGKKEGRKFLMYRKIKRVIPVDEMVEKIINGEIVDPGEIPEEITIDETVFHRIDILSMIVTTCIEEISSKESIEKRRSAIIADNVERYLDYLDKYGKEHPGIVPRDMVRLWYILYDEVRFKLRRKGVMR